MATLDSYRKQAKQLVRWHRERNYSIGEKFRRLERYRHLTDIEALEMPLPLTLAQEIVAVEAGFKNWAALKASATHAPRTSSPAAAVKPALLNTVPILFVRDVAAAAAFYAQRLGFAVDFLHGNPPFYGSISRDRACLHLRFVHAPNFAAWAAREGSLILATIEVQNVKGLFEEYEGCGVEFPQRLVRQPWGGLDFHVRDLDGNVISFVEYRPSDPPAP